MEFPPGESMPGVNTDRAGRVLNNTHRCDERSADAHGNIRFEFAARIDSEGNEVKGRGRTMTRDIVVFGGVDISAGGSSPSF